MKKKNAAMEESNRSVPSSCRSHGLRGHGSLDKDLRGA